MLVEGEEKDGDKQESFLTTSTTTTGEKVLLSSPWTLQCTCAGASVLVHVSASSEPGNPDEARPAPKTQWNADFPIFV